MAENPENHIFQPWGVRGWRGGGVGEGRSLPSANLDNVAAGGATDTRCWGGRGRGGGGRAGVGLITAHSNPCSSFSSSSFPLCVRQGFNEKFCIQQCRTTVHCTIGTHKFDAQIPGIKFWKGDENLRPFNKRFLRYIEWLPAFWTF